MFAAMCLAAAVGWLVAFPWCHGRDFWPAAFVGVPFSLVVSGVAAGYLVQQGVAYSLAALIPLEVLTSVLVFHFTGYSPFDARSYDSFFFAWLGLASAVMALPWLGGVLIGVAVRRHRTRRGR